MSQPIHSNAKDDYLQEGIGIRAPHHNQRRRTSISKPHFPAATQIALRTNTERARFQEGQDHEQPDRVHPGVTAVAGGGTTSEIDMRDMERKEREEGQGVGLKEAATGM